MLALNNSSSFSVSNTSYFKICSVIYEKQTAVQEITTLIIGFMNALLAPVAVSANALVLAVIWRSPTHRTPSFIFLAGLAITDLATGLISQPLYSTYSFLRFADKNQSMNCIVVLTLDTLGRYFFIITGETITAMAVERWMHMSRRSLITVRRAYFLYAVMVFIPVPGVAARFWLLAKESFRTFWEPLVLGTLSAVCFGATSVSYFKVFQIIRLQHRQIEASKFSQSFQGQPTLTLKYKKSVYTVFYILVLFLLCYSPHVLIISVGVFWKRPKREVTDIAWHVSLTMIFMSSSLNPLLYCWRMKEIRHGVKTLIKRIIRKN